MKRLSMAMTALAVMGLMTMVSCRKPNVGNVPGEARTITFNATTESNGGSKTYLDELDVKWSANDKISVNGTEFNLVKGENTTFGSFTGTVGAVPGGYLACYPADATNNGSQITFTIPAPQDGDPDFDSKLPMAAYTTDENGDLSFRNMVNVLKLNLTGSQTINMIEVMSEDEFLSGSFTVGTTLSPSAIAPGTKKITIDYTGNPLNLNTAPTVYVVLPVFGSAESTVTVKFTGTAGVMTVGPKALANSNTPNHRYNAPVAVSLVAPKPDPSSVTTMAGCSGYIYSMGGTVTLPSGGAQQVEYGFVYSETATEPVPEVGKSGCTKFVGGTADMPVGTTSFTVDITGLASGTTYSVRAYAIGESGAAVHAPNSSDGIKTITGGDTPKAIPSNWVGDPDHQVPGASPYLFTVGVTSKGDPIKVRFSQGNLQYIGSAATPYWKFADHQFDFLGTTTGQNSSTATVDRDLFGWGTSGWDNGNTYYRPWDTDNSSGNAYGPTNGSSYEFNLTGVYANSDWGVYNAITNGGNAAGMWRTLTNAEWSYLLSAANNSKWACGKVGSCTPGLIILPDGWTSCPDGCTFTGGVTNFTTNVYSYTQWHDMESAGAVFLPAAGYRGGTHVGDVGSWGEYWSSSYFNSIYAYFFYFNFGGVNLQCFLIRYGGYSVRLVR